MATVVWKQHDVECLRRSARQRFFPKEIAGLTRGTGGCVEEHISRNDFSVPTHISRPVYTRFYLHLAYNAERSVPNATAGLTRGTRGCVEEHISRKDFSVPTHISRPVYTRFYLHLAYNAERSLLNATAGLPRGTGGSPEMTFRYQVRKR